ncbi:MOSC domain-containing protein [Pontivivens insulae]|uniref:MOSC domain-containing protein n=1 Tax=Pontivivens insulae TaxID=1639689 RepID=A0A2R8ADX6_9RHOB|nr:MOSC domain-containing protein [Pontivivens insulae]RED14374.1 hypothetical protein DFR53_1733 [Pontivivens insulae]SPF30451.1 hypothetical protein POI8812_02789 [Pontivivens insulae]
MITVSNLWRYPVKGVGTEPLGSVVLREGQCLPGDRAFAIAQDGATTNGEWAPCMNFVRGAKAGTLMAIEAQSAGESLTFTHPDRPALTVQLPADGQALIDWIAPLYPENRPAPVRVVTATEQGMTDAPFPSISILSNTSRTILSQRAGRPLDQRRFRGNIWLDGMDPWQEWEWIGKNLRIGGAVLEVRERNTRCRATHADPMTGKDDVNVLSVLEQGWDHRDFGVYAVCVQGGEIAVGDVVTVL